MTFISPNKSSSRAGRFKKKLVSEEQLQLESQEIITQLKSFHELYLQSKITQSDFVACYLLVYLSCRFPHNWVGAKRKFSRLPGPCWRSLPFKFKEIILKHLEDFDSLYDILDGISLRSTPLAVNRALLEWAAGNYCLELMFRIPSSREVLLKQAWGKRCVTTLIDERINQLILGERDALSFTMHDLIHADHFFLNNQSFLGQLGFYGLIYQTFDYFNLTHKKFQQEFDYLISDMNAYPVHLLKCLKSAMTHYFDEDYFLGWIASLNPPVGLLNLNTKRYDPVIMDQELLSWLDKFRVH